MDNMEPDKNQFGRIKDKVVSFLKFKDNKIAETTPFGPMSKYQENPENRIIHKSVREDRNER
jgi:hypothetical protein